MKYVTLLTVLVSMLSISNSFAQKTNAQKILGCWVLTKMEFSQPEEGSDELIDDALNSIICFEKNGKFTNQSAKNSNTSNGKYSFAEDGKTIIQSMETQDEDSQFVRVDSNAEIFLLDEKKLIFKHEFGMMYFDRK